MYKKTLSFLLIFCMFCGIMPMSTLAAEPDSDMETVMADELIGDEVVSQGDVSQGTVPQGDVVEEIDADEVMLNNSVVLQADGYSDSGYEYSLDSNGQAIITKYSGSESELDIPGKLGEYKVVKIDKEAFKDNAQLKKVVIPDSVTEIGYMAFSGCANLAEVTLSKGVTSIGYSAFADCDMIKSIEIPASLTTVTSYSAGSDTREGAFNGCDSLKTVTFEEGATQVAPRLFANCTGLKQIEIPGTVELIGVEAFLKCSSLTDVEIPDSVTEIGNGAFRECSSLEEVTIPDSVEKIGYMAFSGCENLTTVTLSKGVTSIGYSAFANCDKIESIEIPASLETVTSYGQGSDSREGAFNGCDSLKTVTFEEGATQVATRLFANCPALEEIVIPDGVTLIGAEAFLKCGSLTDVEIPDSVEEIGNDAFRECSSLEEITIPDSVTKIGYMAFSGCENLVTVTLSKGVTSIGYSAFADCDKIESIEIPASLTTVTVFSGSSDTREGAFNGCDSLKTVTFEEGVRQVAPRLFANCPALEEIVIPDGVTLIGAEAFLKCGSLTDVEIPDSVTEIGESAFRGCTALKTIEIPDSVQKIGNQSFRGCKALTGIAIPNSVTSLGTYVFAECDTLVDVKLGTGITTIPNYAFNKCVLLEKIVLPYRVKTINSNAFIGCTELKWVFIPRATTSIANNVFSNPTAMTIYGMSGTYAEEYAEKIGAHFAVPEMEFNQTELKMIEGDTATLIPETTPVDFTDTFTWSSSDASVATVTDGTVKAVALGTAQITALAGDPDDPDAFRAVCEVKVVQLVTDIAIIPSSLTLEGGETYELTATVKPDEADDKSIEWSSSDESVATVTQDGVVTAWQKGTATITAKALDGSDVLGTCEVTVNSTAHCVESVEGMQSEHPYANNTNEVWIYTLKGAERISVSFSLDTETDDGHDFIYIYDGSGNEIGKYTGTELAGETVTFDGDTVRIRLVSDDENTAYGFQVTSVISVLTVTFDSNGGSAVDPVTVAKGGYIQEPVAPVRKNYQFTGWYLNGEPFSFENPVTESIVLVAQWKELETLDMPTANLSSGTVVEKGTEITLSHSEPDVTIYYTLDGTDPTEASDIYRTAIVVNEDTTVKAFAVKEGFKDSAVATFRYTVAETVVQLVTDITITPSSLTLEGGETCELAATVKPDEADDKSVEWSSSDESVATVTQDGVVTALKKGTATITAKALDGSDVTGTCEVTVNSTAHLWGDVDPEDIPEGGIPEGMWIAGVKDFTYTGKAIKQDIRVYDYQTLLVEKKDYTVSYKNNTNAADSKAEKAPAITVTGKGNYGGKTTVTFSILPIDISDNNPAVKADDLTAAYNGKKQQPVPVVTVNGKKLTNKKNFTLQYPSNKEGAYVEPDTYEILITGTGNYSGDRKISFTITSDVLMSKVKVSSIKTQTYTGEEITPELTVKNGKQTLVEGQDYLVTYENNVEIGTAYAVLEGIGGYSGIKRVSFKITGTAISKAKVTNLNPLTYNGEEQTQSPVLTVKLNGVETQLQENKDYTVIYQKNTDAGTATVIFTGINGYSGTLKKTFKINAYDLKNDENNRFVVESGMTMAYTKGGAKPKPVVTFDGVVLTEGKDYTLKYSNNKKIALAGEEKAPTVTVTGKGNFKGSKQVTFTIVKQDISNLTFGAVDKVYKDKANIYSTKVTITDMDGKKLAAKTDYEKEITYTYADKTTVKDKTGAVYVREAGELVNAADIIPAGIVINVTVRANENGNYTGEITGSYRIVSADISKAKVTVTAQTYTGKSIEPGKDQITVTYQGKTLTDDDYEIVSWSNNVKKGKGTIVIKGLGDYGGTKSVKFNIQSKTIIGFLWW